MSIAAARSRSGGFTLIEILVVVVIVGIMSVGFLLSINIVGHDRELETESARLLTLVNYAREQAELQTREFGVIFHDDGYQFLTYDARRGLWRDVYEDESLRQRRLPAGLDVKLIVDARQIVLVPWSEVKQPDPKSTRKPEAKKVKDINSLKDAVAAGKKLGEDPNPDKLNELKKIAPQVMIFSSGDLSSFEITLEREGGVRSITIALDEKGQVIEKPMVETKL